MEKGHHLECYKKWHTDCDCTFHVRQHKSVKKGNDQGWGSFYGTIYSFMAEEHLGLGLYVFYFQEKNDTAVCKYNISLLSNVLQFKRKQKQTSQFSNLRFWINPSEMMRGEYKGSILEFSQIKIQRSEKQFPKTSDHFSYPSVRFRNIVPLSGNSLMSIFIEAKCFITKWKDNLLGVYE